MKKFLLTLTVGLTVLVGTACQSKEAAVATVTTVPGKFEDSAPGTVEDRRSPMTVPVITAPSTTSTTEVEYADLGEASVADTLYLTGLLSDVADVMGAISNATTPDEMETICSNGLDVIAAASVEVATYTGPNASLLSAALEEWSFGFGACSIGLFELGADYLAQGNALFARITL